MPALQNDSIGGEQAGSSPILGKVQGLKEKSRIYLWSTIFRVSSHDLFRSLVVLALFFLFLLYYWSYLGCVQ